MSKGDIDQWRNEIDRLDRELVELLGRRADCVQKIAEVKQTNGWPVYDPDRERNLLAALTADNRTILPDQSLRRIFREIISACRALQARTSVAFLGPEDTFTHQAAISHFGRGVDFLPRGSISDVFREVEHGRAEFGVVPAENSNNGAVNLTLDEWVESDLKICGELLLPVSQTLMSQTRDPQQIKRVLSHPQALAQCRAWLARNLPHAVLEESASTATAAQQAAQDPEAAAVGPEMLADRHGLGVLARNIQDQPLNLTRFLVLGRRDCRPTGHDKVSMLFVVSHKPGSLYKALYPLAEAGINMTRIESRPTRHRPWEYVFFVDIEGHQEEETVQKALAGLAEHVVTFKILGSYPAAAPQAEMTAPEGNNPESLNKLPADMI